jgi:hypothetical protein
MGAVSAHNKLLSLVFHIKALFSILVSFYVLTRMSLRVNELHKLGVAISELEAKDIVINASDESCSTENSPLGRLEPPLGKRLVGFHLDWAKQLPTDVFTALGESPAVL